MSPTSLKSIARKDNEKYNPKTHQKWSIFFNELLAFAKREDIKPKLGFSGLPGNQIFRAIIKRASALYNKGNGMTVEEFNALSDDRKIALLKETP